VAIVSDLIDLISRTASREELVDLLRGTEKKRQEETDLLKRQVEGLAGALKDSTDRLYAIWRNMGSIGARSQVMYNMILLKGIDPNYKPNGNNRPERDEDKEGVRV
jgi:hypothetical protein